MRRSQSFYDAKDCFRRVSDGFLVDAPDTRAVQSFFRYWMEGYLGGRVVRLRRSDDFVFVRMVNRFMDGYKKRIKKRMMGLKDVKFTHMLSLTVDPNKFGRLIDEFVWIGRQFCRLRAWLYKLFGHFDYVKVLEVTKKGRPHLHVLVKFIDMDVSYIPYDTVFSFNGKVVYRGLKSIWGAFGWIKPLWSGLKPISYCLKYLYKSFKFEGENVVYGALLFASNCRMFSMSQRLHNPSVVKRDKVGYVFDGCLASGVLDWYLVEKDLSVELDVYKFELDMSYPELFVETQI